MITPRDTPCLIDLSGSTTVGSRPPTTATRSYDTEPAIRAFARTALAEIGATPDLDPVELCRRLSIHRDHPIEIISTRMPYSSLLGFCVKTATCDYIVHPDDVTALQRDHGIRHEVGHILLDHHGPATPEQDELLRKVLPNLDPADVITYLGRIGNYVGVEWEAETFAHLLTEAAVHAGHQARAGYFETGLSSPRPAL